MMILYEITLLQGEGVVKDPASAFAKATVGEPAKSETNSV
jgi:hypothetical protein